MPRALTDLVVRVAWASPLRRDVAVALLIVSLGLGLYLPGLGVESLHSLEGKYSLAAREMLRGGPVLVPHLFGELYPDKPPLQFWATAAFGWLGTGRIDETTARLPALVAALATLLVVYRFGSDLFGPRTALIAVAVLGTSNLFFWHARRAQPDQLLTLFVALACWALWRGSLSGPRQRVGWIALAYASMGLGVLSKGLIGLILPLAAATAFLVAMGPIRVIPGRLRVGIGMGVCLAVVLAWYAPAVAQNGMGYVYETLVRHHFVRYVRTWAHPGPWYYYFGEFPAGFFPWVLFLPGAVVLGWRTSRQPRTSRADAALKGTDGWSMANGSRAFMFPLGWFLVGFVFFSLSSGKRGVYLLPLYPAAALIVAWLWNWALASRTTSRWVGVPIAAVSAAAALLALGVLFLPRRLIPGHRGDTMVPNDPWQLAGAVGLLLTGAVILWLSYRHGRPAPALATLVLLQAILAHTVVTVSARGYDARHPVREFAARVQTAVPADQPIHTLLDENDYVVAFYLDRPVVPHRAPGELPSGPAASTPRYALLDNDDRALLAKPGVHVLDETRFGGERVVLARLEQLPR